ncbi:hypothetical protein PILCRDRAFT_4184 [Piloderma croceum F 1598]|uniref:Uncharacterized protein n=1 Tax=Piloderma croceum (strain F 1598) TaxID=765440 RepID=A0A0C3G8F7_PILCF|nr:hypothetical protein PILCRDRAFT_4184 [Piloderma croceum F 1598]
MALPAVVIEVDCSLPWERRRREWFRVGVELLVPAVVLARLLFTGFQSPHRVLNKYIQDLKADAEAAVGAEPPLPNVYVLLPPIGFKFSESILAKSLCFLSSTDSIDVTTLTSCEGLQRIVASFIFGYFKTGTTRDIAWAEQSALAECSVARFVGIRRIQADEPLAILAAEKYLAQNTE